MLTRNIVSRTLPRAIPILGFVGPSGTGKTTLLRKLVPLLGERGLRLGYLKHTHHGFQIDTPGKDSYEVAAAGAAQVMLASNAGWALLDQHPAATEDIAHADLYEYVARFDAARLDLILVEGFHRSRYPKIEIHRATHGKAPLYPEDDDIIAVATDSRLAGDEHPLELPLAEPASIADFVMQCLTEGRLAREDPRDALLHFKGHAGSYSEVRVISASIRIGEHFWLTPDGMSSSFDGAPRRGDLTAYHIDKDSLPEASPTAARIHAHIYREQPEARVLVHAQDPYSVAVSFGGRDFQPLDFAGIQVLGSVPVLSADPAEQPDKAIKTIGEALANLPICLIAGHGGYTWAKDLEQAARRIELLEQCAKIYVLARQAAAL